MITFLLSYVRTIHMNSYEVPQCKIVSGF